MSKKPLKLLILNYEYPPLGGGAGVISQFQAEGLAKLGHHITVLTCSSKNTFYTETQSKNLNLIYLPSSRKYVYKSSLWEKYQWIKFAKAYLKENPSLTFDAAIGHFSIPGGWVAYSYYKTTKTPYFIISHGQDIPWFYRKQMFFYHLLSASLIKRITKKASLLWVQSDMMMDNALRFLKKSPQKVQKIPNGCHPHIFFPNKEKSNPKTHLNLLFAGRLTQQKRPEKLIQIAAILKKLNIAFILTIAGDGPLRADMEKLTHKKKLASNIKFIGWVDKNGIQQLYDKNHILLAPSEAEGMSISILEALFSGLYVIGTPVSGNPDLIDYHTNGALTNGKINAFVDEILWFIKNHNRIDSSHPSPSFINQYNWDTINKAYEKAIYHALTQV